MNRIIFSLIFLAPSLLHASEPKSFTAAPSQLSNVTRHMQTAGYWIARHPFPDTVQMSTEEIQAFNKRIQQQGLTKDIFAITKNFKTESLVTDFDKILDGFTDKGLCTKAGLRNDRTFIEKARRNMNLPGVVMGVKPRYALVTVLTDVRFLPTEEGLYESPGDFDFDQIQNSSFDKGTPVAVVHESLDGKWLYVLGEISDGWVKASDIVIGDQKEVEAFVRPAQWVVATAAKADVYLDRNRTAFNDYVRMGTRLPYKAEHADAWEVLVPSESKDGKLVIISAFIGKAQAYQGYLPYTARHILTQAFQMLNTPYGWGGMYGQQDCSAFLVEVFATMGIVLPRDSKNQALIGTVLAEFNEKMKEWEKRVPLAKAAGGTTLLPMKGHIMLYLGSVDQNPYAIHDIWAYRQRVGDSDVPRVIAKVAVTDLSLGEGSAKGSLFKRLTKIITIP